MPGTPGMAAVNGNFLFSVSFIDYYGIIVVIPHYNSYHEQEKSYQIIGYWRWRSCIK